MFYYTQYKCTFVHNVRINNVPKQCVRLLYTYNLNIEENEVGPDSRQVPNGLCTHGVSNVGGVTAGPARLNSSNVGVSQWAKWDPGQVGNISSSNN